MKKAALLFVCSVLLSACGDDSSQCTPTPNADPLVITSTGISEGSFYSVNEVRQMNLCLVRGVTYTFTFNNATMHPFIFTTDPHGGPSAVTLPDAELPNYDHTATYCVSGCTHTEVTIIPGDTSPDSFFYQCGVHHNVGAAIHVIDAPPAP